MNDNYKDPFGEELFDSVVRQHSRCRIIVHSHIVDNELKGTIDCTSDVIDCETSKTIKSGGGASFVLVPRINYVNYIFPNDYVNIWFDPGDGRGFIRTFFGFVDRVNREISIDQGTGASTTQFQVVCSDFTKAFDSTNIYFNPHIGDRRDFLAAFAGTTNLAGVALRTKGIEIFGTPADIVLNLSILLLGFGSQFMLPPYYPISNMDFSVSYNREFRNKWVKDRLPKALQNAIGADTLSEWVQKQLKMQLKEGEAYVIPSQRALQAAVLEKEMSSMEEAGGFSKLSTEQKNLLVENLSIGEGKDQLKSGLAVEQTSLQNTSHLLDLIDMSFIEHSAIDGSIVAASIWSQQGSIWSLMNAYSNNIVNELFCDLRPVSAEFSLDKPFVAGGYDRAPDEHYNANQADFLGEPAVRYVPAIVMREYPFSTVKNIDISSVTILGKKIGDVVRLGDIFSQDPGFSGRKVVELPEPLNDYMEVADPTAKCYKHLDVKAISIKDIVHESLGRSDHEVFNLIELYSDGLVGESAKFFTQDFQPIVNPISVARHGLRVLTLSTRFSRYSTKYMKEGSVDSVGCRYRLARWALMIDHWNQHNIEYLSGTISTRFFPEVRVGFRLDIKERNESYYIESVNHKWSYPGVATSTFSVSRGQRNDPYPVYIKPALDGFEGIRDNFSRLAKFFKQKDSDAVLRAVDLPGKDRSIDKTVGENVVDIPNLLTVWGNKTEGYVVSGGGNTEEQIETMRTISDTFEYSEKDALRKKALEQEKAESKVSKTASSNKQIKAQKPKTSVIK